MLFRFYLLLLRFTYVMPQNSKQQGVSHRGCNTHKSRRKKECARQPFIVVNQFYEVKQIK